jgi:hypothetical protein
VSAVIIKILYNYSGSRTHIQLAILLPRDLLHRRYTPGHILYPKTEIRSRHQFASNFPLNRREEDPTEEGDREGCFHLPSTPASYLDPIASSTLNSDTAIRDSRDAARHHDSRIPVARRARVEEWGKGLLDNESVGSCRSLTCRKDHKIWQKWQDFELSYYAVWKYWRVL